MKYKIFISLFILILIGISNVSAFFTLSHEKFIIQGFKEVGPSGTVVNECGDKINLVLDGNTAADVPVLHYFDDKVSSYISTHTKGSGFSACMEKAGTDKDLRCFCYGIATHIIQDRFSHLPDGLTTKYLKSYFSSNFFGHMVIEKSFENKHMELIKTSNPSLYEEVKSQDRKTLNSLFPEYGGDGKYLDMLNRVSGLNLVGDAQLFRSGYLGEGFYSTIYKDKVKLPKFLGVIPIEAILIFIIVLCIGIIVLLLLLGKSNYRFYAIIIWIIVLIITGIVFYSLITGTSWKIATFIIEIPAKFGYLSVSQTDVINYDKVIQDVTNEFLRTGQLNIEDASGLSYRDSKGNWIEGALIVASKPADILLLYFVLPGFILLNIWLIYKSFRRKR